jgi:hypothetical protein
VASIRTSSAPILIKKASFGLPHSLGAICAIEAIVSAQNMQPKQKNIRTPPTPILPLFQNKDEKR